MASIVLTEFVIKEVPKYLSIEEFLTLVSFIQVDTTKGLNLHFHILPKYHSQFKERYFEIPISKETRLKLKTLETKEDRISFITPLLQTHLKDLDDEELDDLLRDL